MAQCKEKAHGRRPLFVRSEPAAGLALGFQDPGVLMLRKFILGSCRSKSSREVMLQSWPAGHVVDGSDVICIHGMSEPDPHHRTMNFAGAQLGNFPKPWVLPPPPPLTVYIRGPIKGYISIIQLLVSGGSTQP